MADGSIEFSVELDAKNAEKELQRLKVSIVKLEAELRAQTARKTALEAEMEAAGVAADNANAKLQELLRRREQMNNPSAGGDLTYEDFGVGKKALDAEIKEQQAIVKGLEKDFNDAANAVDKMNAKIDETTAKIGASQEIAGELTKQLAEMPESMETSSRLTAELDKRFSKLTTRISGLFKRVFFFTLITAGLRSIRSWIGEIIKGNDEARAALGRLEGALMTLAAPLVQTVLPAFVQFVDLLTRAAAIAAQGVALLLGTTLQEAKDSAAALEAENAALNGTQKNADKAKRALASFDEINKLTFGKDSESGKQEITPSFDFEETDSGTLERILALATMIGGAIAGWKIGQSLGLGLEQTIGLITALYSAVLFVQAIFDMWENGVTFSNLGQALVGLTGLAVGLGAAFGPVAAAIGLIVGGLALLAAGFHDAFENGFTLQNTLAIIAGLMATGLGISILTGSWIPLLIAAIASVLLAIVVSFGEGDRLLAGLKQTWQGVLTFIKGLLAGDLEQMKQGIRGFFDGIRTIGDAVINAMRNMWSSFFSWLDQKTGGKISTLLSLWESALGYRVERIRQTIGGAVEQLKEQFIGLVEFIKGVFSKDWDLAWQGVKDIFAGAINAVLQKIEDFANNAINTVNSILNAINSVGGKLGLNINLGNLPTIRVPKLAEGAVIPPNSSFLAMLGDQTSGVNIETPLDTMVQAFEMALARNGSGQKITIEFSGDAAQFVRWLNPQIKSDNARIGAVL